MKDYKIKRRKWIPGAYIDDKKKNEKKSVPARKTTGMTSHKKVFFIKCLQISSTKYHKIQ